MGQANVANGGNSTMSGPHYADGMCAINRRLSMFGLNEPESPAVEAELGRKAEPTAVPVHGVRELASRLMALSDKAGGSYWKKRLFEQSCMMAALCHMGSHAAYLCDIFLDAGDHIEAEALAQKFGIQELTALIPITPGQGACRHWCHEAHEDREGKPGDPPVP
jgi:hypothetical protein